MDRVFISHSSHDRTIADGLCAFLESRGIPCWMAPRDISSGNYAGEITRALKTSDVVIILCSRQSCRSEHVKNEVSLAFNHAKLLLPYCLEDDPFDDDLEYYLSSKQRVSASKDKEKDFQILEGIVREFRGQTSPHTPSAAPRKRVQWWWIPTVLLAAVTGLCLLPWSQEDVQEPDNQAKDALVQTTILPEEPASVPTPVKKAQTDRDTFSGSISGGYPDGFGTYTFRRARRIDAHDPEGRMAEPGDYVEGNWTKGHLNYGEWYDRDGQKKGFIQLGDQPDVEVDQALGTCGRS